MKPQQRREKLLRLLRSNLSLTIGDLAEHLTVAQETVRNDVAHFERAGVIRRSRGQLELLQTEEAYEVLMASGALSREERRREILEVLRKRPNIRTPSLSPLFKVSEGTIRNDLIALEKAGDLERRYGEVILRDSVVGQSVLSPTRAFSSSTRFICERALSLVESGDQIFLDDSQCGEYIARHLPSDSEVRVVTNSIRTAAILAGRSYGAEVFVLPGLVQPGSSAIDVKLREIIAERLSVSKAFLCAAAMSVEGALFVENLALVEVFSLMIEMSDSYYVLLESDSFDNQGHYRFPIADFRSKLGEIIIDNTTALGDVDPLPVDYPITICGDNVVLKSPFSKQYVIGFSTLDGSHEFSRIVRNSIEEAAGRHQNVELVITDNKMDPQITLGNVETFVNKKVDLVIEYSQDHQLGPLIAEKLSRSSIPLLAVDIPMPGAVYFGANNYQAGRLAGEAAAREANRRWEGKPDSLVVFTENAAGPAIESRVAGMLEAFLEQTDIDEGAIRKIDAKNDLRDIETKAIEVLKPLGPGIRTVIFAFNAVATSGILGALSGIDRGENTIVVGHNYMQSIEKELTREGTPLLGAVAYYPERYGERIMDIALRVLRREQVDQLNFTDHRWIGRNDGS